VTSADSGDGKHQISARMADAGAESLLHARLRFQDTRTACMPVPGNEEEQMVLGQPQDPRARVAGIAAVVGLHAAVIAALASGLGGTIVKTIIQDSQVELIELPPPELAPPPPVEAAPPEVIPVVELLPIPEVTVAGPVSENAIQRPVAPVVQAPPAEPTRVVPQPVVHLAPVAKKGGCPEADYPALSERLGETGSVVIQALVGTNGRVTQTRIAKSSGYPRLDRAALTAAPRCRFVPGTADGVTEQAWGSVQYTFRKAAD